MATRPRRVEEAGRSAHGVEALRSDKNNQHLFLGQIPEITPDYGDATSLSGTTPAKTGEPLFDM
eukprot:52425-Prymnesium_polylepis.1